LRPQSFVTFASKKWNGKSGTLHDLSWEEFKSFFAIPVVCQEADRPAAIFGKTKDNLRLNKNVESRGFAVIDIEDPVHLPDGSKQGVPFEKVEEELTKLDKLDVSYLWHTTFSSNHSDTDLYRARVIVPLAFSVPAVEWRAFADALLRFFPTQDPKVKNEERLFFLPSVPTETAKEAYLFEARDGSRFAVPEDFNFDPSEKIAPVPTITLDPDELDAKATRQLEPRDLKTLANKLRQKTDEKDKNNARLLGLLAKGEDLAPQGSRHTTAISMIGLLASYFPEAKAASAAAFFAPTLSVWAQAGPIEMTVEKLAQEFSKLRARDVAERAEREAQKEREKSLKLALFARADAKKARATGNEKVATAAETATGTYSAEELEQCKKVCGAKTDEELARRWVAIFQSGSCAFLHPYGYSKIYSSKVAPAAFRNELTRAGLDMRGDDGKPIPLVMAWEKYGFLADRVELSLVAQFSYYDAEREVFNKAICPRNTDLTVEHKPQWEKLIDLMGGKKAEKFKDWLWAVPKVENPLAALYLDATQGAGKGLLTNALCALWRNGRAMAFSNLSKSFQYYDSPLITINEGLGTKASSEVMRRVIGDNGMKVSQKFEPDGYMKGCVRVFITANNADVLNFGNETLGLSDQVATAKRIISIEGERIPGKDGGEETSSASLYLAEMAATDGLTMEERAESFAGHVMWIAENRKVIPGRRFLVEGDDPAVVNNIVTGTFNGDKICNILVDYLLNPAAFNGDAVSMARVTNGELHVMSRFLSTTWKVTHGENTNPPSPRAIGKTMGALSETELPAERISLGNKRSTTVQYWKVDISKLEQWCTKSSYATVEALREALTYNNKNAARKPALQNIEGGKQKEAT
jgi:hypothetical protein